MNTFSKKAIVPILLGTVTLQFQAIAAENKRPNILLIHSDQHRYDCVTHNGNDIVKTPNIDKLASEGMRFTNAYTPIPTSCPARQSLLTGLWPEKHKGLWNYDITLPVTPFDEKVWPGELQKAGYKTGYVGKWHVHETKTPLDFGFDDYVSDNDYRKYRKELNIAKEIALDSMFWFGGIDPADLNESHTHYLAQKCIELIKKYEAAGMPWHIRLDHVEPHLPCFPVKQFLDMYKAEDIPAWKNFGDKFDNKPYIQKQMKYNWGLEKTKWEQWARYMQRYYAIISQVDDAVGMVLKAIDELNLRNNTVVIYTADHGDAAGSHGFIDKHYVMYDEEVHIPFIVRWPGVIKPGSVNNDFVIHELDMAATIPAIAGVNWKSQGANLLPLFKGETPAEWRKYAFSNYNGQQFGLFVQRMIRDNDFKYIWNMTDTDEFYDLKADPSEMKNQIKSKKYAKQIAIMRKALYADLVKREDPLVRQQATKRQLVEGVKVTR